MDADRHKSGMGSVQRLHRWMTVVLIAVLLLVALLCGFTWHAFHSLAQGSSSLSASGAAVSQQADSPLSIPDNTWALTVVSPDQKISSHFSAQLTDFAGIKIDQRVVPALKKMLSDAAKAGYAIKPAEGYVDAQTQEKRYQKKIEELMQSGGKTRAVAESDAAAMVPPGGCSDNQTGMAVTFPSDAQFLASDGYHWLLDHCVDYGFVRRYTDEKEGKTGLKDNPSHFRYVGTYNAQTMRRLGLCLEEYVAYKGNQQVNS